MSVRRPEYPFRNGFFPQRTGLLWTDKAAVLEAEHSLNKAGQSVGGKIRLGLHFGIQNEVPYLADQPKVEDLSHLADAV